jgi:Nodulation protein Z (NodZ)
VDGYVVNRPFGDSNVGSNLSSLAGAHWLARHLGRGLVVDWREMSQLKDASLNYFTEFFEAPSELLGVPIHYAPTDIGYEQRNAGVRVLEPGEAHRIALGDETPEERCLLLEAYHGLDRVHPGPESTRVALLRSLYGQIRLAPRIAAAVESWAAARLDAPFVVGVNVRTGNGQYFRPGMRYADRVDISLFDDSARFLRLLERACRARLEHLPRPRRDEFQIFYATDSAAMSDLLARLPNSVTRRTIFPPPDAGDMYAFDQPGYDDHAAIEDTLVDMFLLARCDALVYNTSLFNQYARLVTGQFGGNLVHFESLLLRKRAGALVRSAGRRLRYAWASRA